MRRVLREMNVRLGCSVALVPLVASFFMHLRSIACSIPLFAAGFFAFGQTENAPLCTIAAELTWHDRGFAGAPVGQWCPTDAFYVDELPWAVFEGSTARTWESAVLLRSVEQWVPVDSMDLTPRQRALIRGHEDEFGDEPSLTLHPLSVAVTFPVFRWNRASGYERFVGGEWAVGEEVRGGQTGDSGGRWTWPSHSVLSEGDFHRMGLVNDGVYAIDAAWLAAAGIDRTALDPRRVRIFGNGGVQLPYENAAERPLDLTEVAVRREGGADGVWDAGDRLLFYGRGSVAWAQNPATGRWEHAVHAYSDSAYYFIDLGTGPGAAEGREMETGGTFTGPVAATVDRFVDVQFHEEELNSPNRSGRQWFGEDFGTVTERAFTFAVPHATAAQGRIAVQCAAQSMGTGSTFIVGAGDLELAVNPAATTASSTSNVANVSAASGEGLLVTGSGSTARIEVGVQFSSGVADALGWLDFVRVEQERLLQWVTGGLQWWGPAVVHPDSGYTFELDGIGTGFGGVWEVTVAGAPVHMDVVFAEGEDRVSWTVPADGARRFIAFPEAGLPAPTYLGAVEPVNLHALADVDLVVVTVPAYAAGAERLAAGRADEGLRVAVVDQRAVFDCFSSGNPDPTAIKMLLLMLMDKAAGDSTRMPKYLQLVGDGTFANRGNVLNGSHIITYQSANSISPTSSYVSDDYFGFLAAEYGEGIGDKLAIGVGRIPARSVDELDGFLAKLEGYGRSGAPAEDGSCADEGAGSSGPWRNAIVLVSDDRDGSGGPTELVHMLNSDEHAETMRAAHNAYDLSKIYLDAYPQLSTPGGERYPDAAEAIARSVESGALVVNYIGHGGERGWAHERVLNTSTVREWTNAPRLPLFMTATCELARFDDPEVETVGDDMLLNPDGGAIAMLTTTRVVFSGSNQQLNRAFYACAFEDTPERPLRLGDIARITKNDPQVSNSSNKRNFSLLGDASMRLNYPDAQVVFTHVPDTLRALEVAEVRGYIADASGDTLRGFDGFVYPRVFDKRATVPTLDNDGSGTSYAFTVFRDVLHRGVASVEGGAFAFSFAVPRDINYAYGNGRISAYAASEDGADAHGYTEDLIVGGVAADFIPDDVPPVVRLFLNDTLFRSGGIAGPDPVLFARIADAGGINASGTGIGHDIKMTLDGASGEAVVLNEYYQADLNTYISGTVRFPLQGLADGPHRIDLVVWDVSNNKGSASLDFIVADNLEAALGDVTAYPNPATDEVRLRFGHNLACTDAEVRVDVFASDGRCIESFSGPLDAGGFLEDSWVWQPATSHAQPGVYLFRITLTDAQGGSAQYSERVVVVRP